MTSEKKQSFKRSLLSLYVIFHTLSKKQRDRFIKGLRANSYKKFFENKKASIFNIQIHGKNRDFFYFNTEKKGKNQYILLSVHDLPIIKKNINYLFKKEQKTRS